MPQGLGLGVVHRLRIGTILEMRSVADVLHIYNPPPPLYDVMKVRRCCGQNWITTLKSHSAHINISKVSNTSNVVWTVFQRDYTMGYKVA